MAPIEFLISAPPGWQVDLDQLHTFLEIVRLKSFSKAAQTCFRTQPAISAQVRQLEQELNTQLFERFGSRISLTEAGRVLAGYAEQILELRRRAQDSIHELERTPRGDLVMVANEGTCTYVLPGIFAEYKRQFPNVHLQIERAYGSRIVEAVLENQADFGVAQLPIEERKLQIVPIHSDQIRLVVPAGHPLAAREAIFARELAPFPLLLPKYGTTRARLNEWLELVEDEVQISMEVDSTEMIKRLVMAGLGVSFLAETHCREEVAGGGLSTVALAPEPILRRLALVYRKDKALSRAALAFIQTVLENTATAAARPAARALGRAVRS